MKAILACIIALTAYFLPSEQAESIEEIRFSSSTRGYSKDLTLRPDQFTLQVRGSEGEKKKSRKTTKAEWEQLVQALPDLPLNELARLESPSNVRAMDGALYSTIIIKTNKTEYRSSSFDNYSPHKQLLPLVELIRKIEKNLQPPNGHW